MRTASRADLKRVWSRRACLPALGALALALSACAAKPDPARAGPTYPEHAQERTLDIQVVRDDTVIRLTNTTAQAFGPSRLWLNRWYSRPIERLDVGQTLELSLWDFYDEHGEPFRAGGFFATRRPERLVLAQLQPEGSSHLYGLVVVARGED